MRRLCTGPKSLSYNKTIRSEHQPALQTSPTQNYQTTQMF